ncbi:MAG: zinc-binding dehydrogenase [Pseudomonadales bacterium]
MTQNLPATMLQLRSTVTSGGELKITLDRVDVPKPREDEVLVRVEASPINPSDLGLLLAGADPAGLRAEVVDSSPALIGPVPPAAVRALAGRLDKPMPVGNEGAGVVVETGSSEAARSLLGRTVAVLGGAMYGQYRCLKVSQCLLLNPGTTPRDGASCFVNPLTALGMVETMRLEGHKALLHTAAASNLGQMLVKICLGDGVPLVNVVRRPEQAALLREIGATHVVDSSADDFEAKLVDALAETGATLGFDATGGGKLAGQILSAMEAAALRNAGDYSRYGSTVYKQVYIYGGLDRSPTVLNRNFGMSWGLGGWLLTPFLERIGPEATARLKQRVADEIHTTFASHYAREVSLAEALSVDAVREYGRQATGTKFLINPQL